MMILIMILSQEQAGTTDLRSTKGIGFQKRNSVPKWEAASPTRICSATDSAVT